MATTWRILAQRQIDNLTPQGTFEPSMQIDFETIPEGIAGQVVVPLRQYTEQFVRESIDSRVGVMQAVQNL